MFMPADNCIVWHVSIPILAFIRRKRCFIPKEITIDATDSPHLSDFGSQTNDFRAHVRTGLDDHVGVVRELRRGGISIVLYLVRHQLWQLSAHHEHGEARIL